MKYFTHYFVRFVFLFLAFFEFTMSWAQKSGDTQAISDAEAAITVSNEDALQSTLDNYSGGTLNIYISQNIVLTKQIIVRNNCKAVISGSTISLSSNYSSANIFSLLSESLTLKNITFDLSNAHSLSSCIVVSGKNNVLTIASGVIFRNVSVNIIKTSGTAGFYLNNGGTIIVNSGNLPKIDGRAIHNYNYGKIYLKGSGFFQQGRFYNDKVYSDYACEYYLDGALTNEMTFEGAWGQYAIGVPFIKSGNYQMQASDFSQMHFTNLPSEGFGITAGYDSDNHAVVIKYYNQVTTVDQLQARFDAIAAKGQEKRYSENVVIADDGVLIDKPLYVRNGCEVYIKGGPLRLSPDAQGHYPLIIEEKGRLIMYNDIDMMSDDFHLHTGIMYNCGYVYLSNTKFFNVPSGKGKYGEHLFYCAPNSNFHLYTSEKISTSNISVFHAAVEAHIDIWDSVLESCYVPTIDGEGIVHATNTHISGGGKGVSIVNASIFTMGSDGGSCSLNDTQGGSTYITADDILCSIPFLGDGNNIVVGKHGQIGGASIPTIYLKKDAYVTLRSDSLTLDAAWADFTFNKTVVDNVKSQEAYEALIFVNMPDDREAYYDETDNTVKLCEKKSSGKFSLQEFINNNVETPGPVIVDLSNFYDVVRETTLNVCTGNTYRFVNGTLERAVSFGGPVMWICGGSTVDVGEDAVITGQNRYASETIVMEEGTLNVTQGVVEGGLGYPQYYMGNPVQSAAVRITSPYNHFYLGDGNVYGTFVCNATGADIRFDKGKIRAMGLRSDGGSDSRNSHVTRATMMGTRSPYITLHSDIHINSTSSENYNWGYMGIGWSDSYETTGTTADPFYITLYDQSILHLQNGYEGGFELTFYDKHGGDLVAVGEYYTITSEDVERMNYTVCYTVGPPYTDDRESYLELRDNCIYLQFTDEQGIGDITSEEPTVADTYDALGRKTTSISPAKSLRLQRMSDGTVRKIMMK